MSTDTRTAWDVLHLLEEYEQSVEEMSNCLRMLLRFFRRNER